MRLALFVLAGFLLGGAISLRSQGRTLASVALAVVAVGLGVWVVLR